MRKTANVKTGRKLKKKLGTRKGRAMPSDIYEYVCLLSRAVFESLPESHGGGIVKKIPASVVAGMCSTIIRRMVEEIHRTGTSELLASLIAGDTVSPFGRESIERAVRDLKERKHSIFLVDVFREIMLDFTADVTSDVCTMEPYLPKKEDKGGQKS
jgi:hypothetical protein